MQMDQSGDNHKKGFHIKDWPEKDRPRELLVGRGPQALSDAALLAIVFRTGEQKLHYAGIASWMQ